jgi:hypothetical protein
VIALKNKAEMKKNMPFAVKAEILKELVQDPIYSKRLESAKEFDDVIVVVKDFAKKRGE